MVSEIEAWQKEREIWESRIKRNLYLPVLCYFFALLTILEVYLFKNTNDNIYFNGLLMASTMVALCISSYTAGESKRICLSAVESCMKKMVELKKKKEAGTIIKGDGESKEKS